MGWGQGIFELVFPARCVACHAAGSGICASCREGLEPAPPGPAPPGVDWLVAPYAYTGAVREAVTHIKYRNERAALAILARDVAAAVRAGPGVGDVDVVTWPATSAARRRERGFDQAQLLARAVARELHLPAAGLLRRRGGDAAQTGRTLAARTVAGPQFQALRSGSRGQSSAAGVLLVDDVVTSGATLAAASGALHASGQRMVAAAVIARTVLKKSREVVELSSAPEQRRTTRSVR